MGKECRTGKWCVAQGWIDFQTRDVCRLGNRLTLGYVIVDSVVRGGFFPTGARFVNITCFDRVLTCIGCRCVCVVLENVWN